LIDTSKIGERGGIIESVAEGLFAIDDAQGIGDFNGDGLDDIVLAVKQGPQDGGHLAVVLVYGRPGFTSRQLLDNDFLGAATFRLRNPAVTGSGRVLISPAGDLNGDGLKDFLFRYADYRQEANSGKGIVLLVHGSSGLEGEQFVEDVGAGVPGVAFVSPDPTFKLVDRGQANIGDFNGDRMPDLALGAFSTLLGNGDSSGMVAVLFRTKNLPPEVNPAQIGVDLPGFRIHGRAREGLANGISPAGDFNGDGWDDFLITAGLDYYSGTVYLVYGRANPPPVLDLEQIVDGPSKLGVVVFKSPTGRLFFGAREQAVGVGDLNSDGFDDVMIGAAADDSPFGDTPKPSVVYLFYGQGDFPSLVDFDGIPQGLGTAIHPPDGGFLGDHFGLSLAPVGDMNLDGVPDFLIGAPRKSAHGLPAAGEADIIYGKRAFGPDLSLANGFSGIRVLGEVSQGGLGFYTSAAGDFNGDGGPDVLIAGPNLNTSGRGKAYVIYGLGSHAPPFTLLEIDPPSGPIRGGTKVLIHGSGFEESARAFFGGLPAGTVTPVSGSELLAIAPPAVSPGAVDVEVRIGAEVRRLTNAFEYVPNLPEINLERLGPRGLRLDGDGDNFLGRSMAFGDINGDGIDDLVVGSETPQGWIVSIVRGGKGLPEAVPAFIPSSRVSILKGPQGRSTAAAVAFLGDVNHDGIPDVGISAEDGTGYILLGRAGLPEEIDLASEILAGRALRLAGGAWSGQFSLAPLGDLTGDGIADFAVGFSEAPMAQGEPPGAGAILFVEGRDNWPETLDLSSPAAFFARIHGVQAGHKFAMQVVNVGDVNGDKSPDLLADSMPFSEGARSYLIFTQNLPNDVDIESHVQHGEGVILDRVGRTAAFTSSLHLAAAGDVNKDGFSDFLLGDETGADLNRGLAFLVHGGPSLPALIPLTYPLAGASDQLVVLGEAPRVQAGEVSPAGDFNGDGFDDFLLGSQSPLPPAPGSVSVIFGAQDLSGEIQLVNVGAHGFRLEGRRQITRIATRAPGPGDLNGDGRPDFVFSEVGSPGAVYVIYGLSSNVPFVRGDASFNGIPDISDAILVLSYLFLGGPLPPCLDAADTDDHGTIQIGDAIYLLNFLFMGGSSPPEPFPDSGVDPTEDSLDCPGF
jgi:hypothetical protein